MKAYNLLVPEDIKLAREKINLILSNNLSSKSEYTAVRKDGSEFPIIIYSNTITSNGEFVGLRGLIFDVSEIKQAEQEVHKLFHIIEQSPVSILITDTNGIIEYANPRFTELTGYTLDEVRGQNPGILKSGQTSDQEYSELWSKIKSGIDWKGEFYNRKKNGEYYWEAAWISPVINEKGQITHFISADEDITEKKESDRQILHAIIEAEENERTRFSRELHDGLGPIMSTAKLYFQWLADNTDPLEKIRIVEKGNNCINDAIQSLREISNNLSPRVLSNLGVIAAIQNFINLLNDTEKLIVDFNFNIERRFEKNLEITIYRVSTELINNTIKYAHTTRAGLSLNFLPEDSLVVLDYFDNGKGFDLKEGLNSRNSHGLLNIQQRVNTLNGKVIMKSSPGIGVKVHIELPIEEGIIERIH
jgi:PAS domain S-box-containing protein